MFHSPITSICIFAVINAQFCISFNFNQIEEFRGLNRQSETNTAPKPLTNLCPFDSLDTPESSNQQTPSPETSSASLPAASPGTGSEIPPETSAAAITNPSIRFNSIKPKLFDQIKRSSNSTICSLWDLTNSSWILSSANNAFFNGGPLVDANNSTSQGYLVLDLFTNHMLSPASCEIKSLLRPPTGPQGVCLTFAYAIDGLGAGGLEIVLSTYDSDDCIDNEKVLWRDFDISDGKWQNGSISFASSKSYKISFKGVGPDGNYNLVDFRGYVAIDETQLFEGFCKGDCNFDLDTCQWENDQSDDFDWQMGWGTHFSNTGPANDHSDYGGYLYVDSNYPRRTADVARILSPTLTSTEPFCFRFWISEFGTGLGPLSVFISPLSGNSTLVLTIKEPLGAGLVREIWYPAQVAVSWPTEYRVIIEAVVGVTARGNIAIDDLSFQHGSCSPLPTSANGRVGECAFIEDRCKWTVQRIFQPLRSPDLWKLVKSGNQVAQPKGHTILPDSFIDGYMKFETNSYMHHALDRSRILSPMLPPTDGNLCMNFWVYMATPITSQKGLGGLQVLLLNSSRSMHSTVIWKLENHQFPHWIHSQVPISSSIPFQIAFEGIRGAQVLGLIAVDDISFVYPSITANKQRLKFKRQAPQPPPAVGIPAEQPPAGPPPAGSPPAATPAAGAATSEATVTPGAAVTPGGGEPQVTGPGVGTTPIGLPGGSTPSVNEPIVSLPSKTDSCIVLPIKAKVFPADCSFDIDFCDWSPVGPNNDVKWQMATPSKSPKNVRDRTYNIPQAGFIYFDPFTPAGNPTTASIESLNMRPAQKVKCLTFWFMIYGNDITASLSVVEHELNGGAQTENWKQTVVTRAPQWRFAEILIGTNQTGEYKIILSSTSRAATIVIDDIKFYDDRCRSE